MIMAFILDVSPTKREMDWGLCFLKIICITKENGLMILLKEEENLYLQLEISMMVSGKIVCHKVKACM